MSDQPRRSPARLLAPLALVVFSIALLMVLGGGLGGGDDDGGSDDSAETTERTTGTGADRPRERRERTTYTVKLNDTLGGIAEDTGVPVETLLELNPELDPQALVTGQKVKLRE